MQSLSATILLQQESTHPTDVSIDVESEGLQMIHISQDRIQEHQLLQLVKTALHCRVYTKGVLGFVISSKREW